MASIRAELVKCLQRLSAAADVQAQYLREIGTFPSADELALEFSELVQLMRDQDVDELSSAVSAQIETLDRHLDSFSGNSNRQLWTVDALSTASEWKRVRAVALACLIALGEAPADT